MLRKANSEQRKEKRQLEELLQNTRTLSALIEERAREVGFVVSTFLLLVSPFQVNLLFHYSLAL